MNRKTILGIVAEYDPLHNGHVNHLNAARGIVRPDTVYTVISPALKQRGLPSMFSPHDRAACALHEGADAVFALPVLWTVRDAEHYALGAVSLLSSLGVTHLAFGAEYPDISVLQHTADLLENPPDSMTIRLKDILSEGTGYPAAISLAASEVYPESVRVLSSPNNILAVCYLRALMRLHSSVTPVVIPRPGKYHDTEIAVASPSASAIRDALLRGAYHPVISSVPAFTSDMIRKRFLDRQIPDMRIWNTLVTDCLRTGDLSVLPDLSEGLDSALRKAASASCRESVIESLVSRRYTEARISRLCAMALLGVTAGRLSSCCLPDRTLLLALRRKNVPTAQWKDLPVRIYTSAADWKSAADSEDLRSWSLRSECSGMPDTSPFTEKIYTE